MNGWYNYTTPDRIQCSFSQAKVESSRLYAVQSDVYDGLRLRLAFMLERTKNSERM
ncbi:hypothetical protein NIES4072_23370 [Nostoc commune NIES-4072]|uniref:Uncharacterized protein n=1 Tax=Nostoc commune NIES-4072 TaxID=2005467 RepID=A0A2R5FIU7_NOSCO|nr:hypothetical protein NIES4070_03440 [Nostoc commune HK-02]GBG18672.1 hypothetical protein NIES4072_23370 [Nostoc commune NIES-4072]